MGKMFVRKDQQMKQIDSKKLPVVDIKQENCMKTLIIDVLLC